MDADTVEGTMRLLSRFNSLTAEERSAMREKALECYQRRYALNNAAQAIYQVLGLNHAKAAQSPVLL